MNDAGTDPLMTAHLAEEVASELAAAADHLGKKGKVVAARALLEEARRHNVQAIRSRAQARGRRGKATPTSK
jgi:hypothetical protein